MKARALDARLRKLEGIVSSEPLTVILTRFADHGAPGAIRVDGVEVPRLPGEGEDDYLTRASEMATTVNGVRVIERNRP